MALTPPSNPIGGQYTELKRIDSTNDFARTWSEQGEGMHGAVFFAWEQTAGRGQFGKSWHGESGQNLAMSILLKNQLLPDTTPFHLSACIALCVNEVMASITRGDTCIKWPNDLYWKSRKLGGLLIESGHTWTIVGIGLNINQTQFPDSLPNPVSLKQITGKELDPKTLSLDIIRSLNQGFSNWERTGFEPLFDAYQSQLFGKDESFQVREQGIEKWIRIKDVTPDGELRIEEDGNTRIVVSGLEWNIRP